MTDRAASQKPTALVGASVSLVIIGFVTLVLSFGAWGSCPNTPCGGIFMAISDYSGIELGFGVVTAVAGLALVAIGLDGLRRRSASRVVRFAPLLALVIVAAAGASIVWMYILPGEDKDFYWPPFLPIVVGAMGLLALVPSVRLRRAASRRI